MKPLESAWTRVIRCIAALMVVSGIHAETTGCSEETSRLCHGTLNCTDVIPEFSLLLSPHYWTKCILHEGKQCLFKREQICYGEVTCGEVPNFPCKIGCDEYYRCLGSNSCFRRDTVCNGNKCDGCPEDHEWTNGQGFKCVRNGNACILPQQLLYDDIADCDGGADFCFKDQWYQILDHSKCFRCLDKKMIIPSSRVCDGTADCSDLSDECLCEERIPDLCNKVVQYEEALASQHEDSVCSFGEFLCGNGACIDRSSVCNGVRDCDDDEEFSLCAGTIPCIQAIGYEPVCRCTSHKLGCHNFYGTACDDIADCPIPSSDKERITSENTFPQDECYAKCANSNFSCRFEMSAVGTGVGYLSCGDDYISLPNPSVCDGFRDCEPKGEDERNCRRFYCRARSLVSIEFDQVCDGTVNCDNGEDETAELCGSQRFYCPAFGGKKVSVPNGTVCDFNINCDNGEDEMNCTDERFYCENGDPLFVRKRQTFDGRGDCSDWSDECPSSSYVNEHSFSSRYELLSNSILRALVWIMGILGLGGNTAVICKEVMALRNNRKIPASVRANRAFVLNLAFSDIFMGIYLIGLAAAGVSMKGIYCSRDLEWRSSTACITLGVLSVISSETSVVTMLLLTASRLYTILKPFKAASRPRVRSVLIGIALAWLLSLTIALIPVSPALSNIFVETAKFAQNPFSRNVQMSLDNATTLFRRMMTYAIQNNSRVSAEIDLLLENPTWMDLRRAEEKYFGRSNFFEPQQYFGYYSAHSVCIPKFFVTTADPAWQYSLAINVMNFASFVFVASSYMVIYCQTRQTNEIAGRDNTNKVLQRKILRLVATDFCCWMPICVMAFVKLGGIEIGGIAYAIAAVVLLPINSALNPILYSDLPEQVQKCFRFCFKNKCKKGAKEGSSSFNSSKTRDTEL